MPNPPTVQARRLRSLAATAALAVAAPGCGDDGGGLADAAAILADGAAGVDAAPGPDAPPPQITLVATGAGAPLAGVRVVFLDDADAVVRSTTTDAAGMASASLPLGGKVLAAEVGAERVHLWLGARPGDVLRVRYGDRPPERGLDVAVPPLPAQGTVYDVHTRCGDGAGTTSPVNLSLPTACTSSDVAVVARDGAGGHAGGFLATGQALPPSGTLDLTARTFTPAVSRTFTVTGLDNGEFASLNSVIRIGASGIAIQGLSALGTVSGGSLAATAAQVDLPGADWVTRVIDRFPNGGQLLYQRAPITTTSFDVGPVRLVEPTVPVYDEARREVTWTTGPTGRPYDGVFVRVGFLLADQTSQRDWLIAAPGGAAVVRLPPLPPELADLDPGADPFASGAALTGFVVPGGYDRARAELFVVSDPSDFLDAAGTAAAIQASLD